jgi:hypothetical protein
MPVIPPEALLIHIRGAVETIAEPADQQLEECLNGPIQVPVDEIFQSLGDMVPLFFERLKESGLLDPELERSLLGLMAYFDHMRSLDHPRLWEYEGLDEPEWEEARRRARRTLRLFPPEQQTAP